MSIKKQFSKWFTVLGLLSIGIAYAANRQVQTQETIFGQISTPSSPSSGKTKLYSKSGSSIYYLNSSGTEKSLIDSSYSFHGDVNGTAAASVVVSVGGSTSTGIAAGSARANSGTSSNTASTIMVRDGSGQVAATTFTGALSGNATTSTSFTGSLSGDVGGTQSATTISNLARSKIAAGTAYHVVTNDASGNLTSVAPGSTGNILTSDGTQWTSAAASAANVPTSSSDIKNVGLAVSLAGNAMTIALKQAGGSDCAAGNSACLISFRNAVATVGQYSQVSVTAALTTAISSGSTLGSTNNKANWVYVYAINNAGTVELATAGSKFVDDGTTVSTTAEGGFGGAGSKYTLYSLTARSSIAARLIGRIKSTQATAGTWVTVPSEISLWPFEKNTPRSCIRLSKGNNGGSVNTGIERFQTNLNSFGSDITYSSSAGSADSFTVNTDGLYSMSYSFYNGSTMYGCFILNGTQGTTTCDAATDYSVLGPIVKTAAANAPAAAVVTWYLNAGDSIMAMGVGTSGDTRTRFSMCKVKD